MRKIWHQHRLLLFSIIFLGIAWFWEHQLLNNATLHSEVDHVAHVMEEKESILDHVLENVARNPASIASDKYSLNVANQWDKLSQEGISFNIYRGDSLIYWTSSETAFDDSLPIISASESLKRLPTGWYLTKRVKSDSLTLVGYILLKQVYPYHNKYLRDHFPDDFRLPPDFLIHQKPASNPVYNVNDNTGKFHFSLEPTGELVTPEHDLYFPSGLYFIALLFFLVYTVQILNRRIPINNGPFKILLSVVIAVAVYYLVNQLDRPAIFEYLRLFSPVYFAAGSWLPSLGEFFLLSILLLYVALVFFRSLDVKDFHHPKRGKAFLAFPFLFAAFYFTFTIFLFQILILNSSINFEFYQEMRISLPNVLGFISLVLQCLGFLLIALRLRFIGGSILNLKQYLIAAILSALLALVVFTFGGQAVNWFPFSFYIVIITALYFIRYDALLKYRTTFLVVYSLLAALLFDHMLFVQVQERNTNIQKVLAVNLASERDPAAELFLSDLEPRLHRDTLLQTLLVPPYDVLEQYLRKNYFTGFWRDYDLQVTVCGDQDSVLVKPDNDLHPCQAFFENMVSQSGVEIPGSDFYFMDKLNGRISYFGQMDFKSAVNGEPLTVFVELNSRLIPEGQGYPELLLDERAARKNRRDGFCYAKYYNNKLVDRSGKFAYTLSIKEYLHGKGEFYFYDLDGYSHCAYHISGNNYTVVSYPKVSFVKRLASFPYLFLLTYIAGLLVIGLNNPRGWYFFRRHWDFRRKIQFSLISILLGTLLIIGFGIIAYNYAQFRESIQENLNEKIRTVSAELEMRLGREEKISPDMENYLDYELIQLSDISWVDVNLFDTTGTLMATSRDEIYERGLTAPKMNPRAFYAMSVEHRTNFLHREKLGNMTFYSSYVPVFNNNNQLLGYLNIPYLSKQNELMQQISGFIVAFLNIYIFLTLISVMVAVFISSRITAPLRTIEENLRGIQLGKANAKITYRANDEIGRLVKEYNLKVDELAESAELLARSERESAWREMARQIAHEIKNPLTPMKLSIQYLQRARQQEKENFDEYFNKVTRTLIDQIETLSAIASAFSNFARMPKAHYEKLDLCDRLQEVANLFDNNPHVSVQFQLLAMSPVFVLADKEQLGRAFINLVKNGMQAIPKNRKGSIEISLTTEEEYAQVEVADNGIGVADELRGKLFEPNFTTKTSGMGLGLAITKNIIENLNGKIWFETSPMEGTRFFIRLPLYSKERHETSMDE